MRFFIAMFVLCFSVLAHGSPCQESVSKVLRWSKTPAKIAAVTALVVLVYEPITAYQQEKTLNENLARNEAIYSDQILYDVRFQDIKSRIASSRDKKEALIEAFWRNQNLKSYYENWRVQTPEVTSFEQVNTLLQYPQFEHLRRVYKEKDLRIETWDNLIQENIQFYANLQLVDKILQNRSYEIPDDPFFQEILGMKREGLISTKKARYILHQWFYWKKTFEELRLLHITPEKDLTLENVENYLFAVADGKESLPESLDELTRK